MLVVLQKLGLPTPNLCIRMTNVKLPTVPEYNMMIIMLAADKQSLSDSNIRARQDEAINDSDVAVFHIQMSYFRQRDLGLMLHS